MIQKYTYRHLTWIDLESPNSDELAAVMKEYKLHPLVAEELANPTPKPRVEFYPDYIYLILHIPVRQKVLHKYIVVNKEIDFVIGKNFLITSKYDAVEPLHNFSRIFETNAIIDKSSMGEHAGFIFYYMIKRLYKNIDHDIDAIRNSVLSAENHVFSGEEKTMVTVLSNLSRELIDFHHTLREHKNVIEALSEIDKDFFGEEFSSYINDIATEYNKTIETVANNRDLVTDLRETNDSLLSAKQNETIKILTLMAFVTFPLSLITDIFSMDTTHAPIIGSAYDFEIILGILILVAGGMFVYFKRKKWL